MLSFASAKALGFMEMVLGGGMLVGSLLMSAWGGPRRRIMGVVGFILLASAGLFITGLYPSLLSIGAGLLILTICIPLASGPSQAIFQSKVEPAVQGRVFAIRSMISRSMMPLAFLVAGPLADKVFEPLFQKGGPLASSFAAQSVGGPGPGRGIAFMFVLSGLTLAVASLLAYANPRIRHVEEDLPEVLPSESAQEGEGFGAEAAPAD